MSAKFSIVVKPLPERIAEIAHECSAPSRKYRFYGFRDEPKDLEVVRLPIALPVYRIANYRTNILQLRFIREKQKQSNFFSAGEENESTQRIQHEFLWQLAQTEKESITSIIDTLDSEKQREPILISATGVVVNGNRRLSAMRELYAEAPDRYDSFSHIDCMVLPATANEDDLKDIEVRLQMTPETRLPYGWINECLAIKDLQDRGRKPDAIGSLMRLEPSKVRDKLLMLNEIDLYLRDWQKAEADYDQLNDAEEIVSQITVKLKKKEGVQKEIARHLGWILLDQRGKDGRVYELRETTGTLTQAVVNKLQEVYSSDISSIETGDNDDDLEFEIEGSSSNTSEQNLIAFLKRSQGNDQAQQDIVNICRVVVESQKTRVAGTAALKSASDAHRSLVEIDLTSADPSTHDAIRKQLEAIEQRVQTLKTQLQRYQSK